MQITISQGLPADLMTTIGQHVSPVSAVVVIGALLVCCAVWHVLNPPRRRF